MVISASDAVPLSHARANFSEAADGLHEYVVDGTVRAGQRRPFSVIEQASSPLTFDFEAHWSAGT